MPYKLQLARSKFKVQRLTYKLLVFTSVAKVLLFCFVFLFVCLFSCFLVFCLLFCFCLLQLLDMRLPKLFQYLAMHNYESFTSQANLVHFTLLRFSAKIKVAHEWPGHVRNARISLIQADVFLENVTR